MLTLPEVPRHRKRAPARKPFVLRWRWHGDRSKLDRLQLGLVRDWIQRYATEKAAAQAREDWERGRGIWGSCRRPPLWTVSLELPKSGT